MPRSLLPLIGRISIPLGMILPAGSILAQPVAAEFTYNHATFWRMAPTPLVARVHFVRHRVDRAAQKGWLGHERAERYYRQLSTAMQAADVVRSAGIPDYARPGQPQRTATVSHLPDATSTVKRQLDVIAASLATEVRHNEW